ncbi:hypothetical protein HMPREF3195_00181 [Peptostreptococcus anaerobius]|uniref:Uncharacterized protein n=1 Tax=Peptostreptococcus anaerobius TaxID=1261 RepID=A0A135YYH5_9FIRM|nr:hypothetical protein HMPREF9998_00625 [Peptostreptococcus anaerobius VPI 4330 = DSM 2949]KXI14464.1 hypothetical protein HMPREF3195_00181 [Peptostreptococcus anaerobius]
MYTNFRDFKIISEINKKLAWHLLYIRQRIDNMFLLFGRM